MSLQKKHKKPRTKAERKETAPQSAEQSAPVSETGAGRAEKSVRAAGKTQASNHKRPKRTMSPRHRRINQILMYVMLGVSAVTIIALLINTVRVVRASSTDSAGTEEGMTANTGQSMKNDVYIIGNNPTDIEKEYFQKLTDALTGGNPEEIAEAVVYNFVSDYFTWTNKDGNYEVGGLQYIFAEKYSKFEEWSRWYQYSNMDLYISQYGRDNLPQVKEITTEKPTYRTDDFTVLSVEPAETYPCYQVQVAWTYEPVTVDTTDFPNRMRFQVADHDGRFEIVEFYDMPSVEAWEAENGSSDSGTDTSETAGPEASDAPAEGSEG